MREMIILRKTCQNQTCAFLPLKWRLDLGHLLHNGETCQPKTGRVMFEFYKFIENFIASDGREMTNVKPGFLLPFVRNI